MDIANITDVKKVINTSVKTGNQRSLIRTLHHSRDAYVFQKKHMKALEHEEFKLLQAERKTNG